MEKEKTRKVALTGTILLAVAAVIASLVWFFFGNGEERRTSTNISTSSSYIDCTATQPEDAFFSSDLSANANQKIKVTFNNEGIDKIAYTYTGKFATSEIAEEESGRMTFDYNTFMGQQTPYNRGVLSPAFSPIENKLVVNLFMANKYFDNNTAKLVFLSPDEYSRISEIESVDNLMVELKKIYESKMFICEIKK